MKKYSIREMKTIIKETKMKHPKLITMKNIELNLVVTKFTKEELEKRILRQAWKMRLRKIQSDYWFKMEKNKLIKFSEFPKLIKQVSKTGEIWYK